MQIDMAYLILSIIVAAVVNFIIGAIWYAKGAFGKIMAQACKMSKEECKCSAGQAIAGLVMSLVQALGLALIISWGGAHTWLVWGAPIAIWFCFLVTNELSGVVWAKMPAKLFAINAAYGLISLIVMAQLIYWIGFRSGVIA